MKKKTLKRMERMKMVSAKSEAGTFFSSFPSCLLISEPYACASAENAAPLEGSSLLWITE